MSLDDLARRLAEPMPRRRALGVIGGAVAGLALGGVRPSRSVAQSCRYQACPSKTNPAGLYCCGSAGGSCCYGPSGDAYACCLASESCDTATGQCIAARCPTGRTPCGSRECCRSDQVCQGGRCVKKCPDRRVRCGSRCCRRGERCVNGRCRRCGNGAKGCGRKCCGRDEFCCNPRRGTCCKTKGGQCCFTDPDNMESSGVCCQSPSECARVGTLDGTNVPGKGHVCCPPSRQSPGNGACCPPGSTAHPGGNGIVAVGVPLGCCPNDRLCNGRCLARAPGSGVDERCCGGTPRNVASDPANCGACGNVCPSGQGCFSGVCG